MSDRTVCDEWADDFRAKLKEKERAKDTRIATLERDLADAVSWIRVVGEEMESRGDRTVTLAAIRTMRAQLAERTRERDRAIAEARAFFDEHAALVARAESAEQQVRALREALRVCVIDSFTPHPFVQKMVMCHLCNKEWPFEQPERHSPGCLAALAPAQQDKT